MKASSFAVIPIWAPRSKWNDIILLSHALNQNIAGAQREQCFTKKLMHARLKWREMESPQPSFGGRTHSDAYMVELAPQLPTLRKYAVFTKIILRDSHLEISR